jgi:hypothetical protein
MRFLPRDFPPATNYFGLLAGGEDRPLPTSLDILSLLGSSAARSLLDESDVFDDSVYRRTHESIERQLEMMTYGDWTRDLYWGWLHCLSELQLPPSGKAPGFMASPIWGFKELSTGSAAWAAIRYQAADAALSRRQRRGPPAAGVPVLVEPYPGLYSRLGELIENLRDRLWEHYLLDDTIDDHMSELIDFLKLLEQASKGILADGAPPREVAAALSDYARVLGRLAGHEAMRRPGEDSCVLLSDVAYEDLDTGRILQNAVGTPDIIYVVADLGEGETVFAGAVHSFFEMELSGREELETVGWPSVLRSCPVNRPYWVSNFVVE